MGLLNYIEYSLGWLFFNFKGRDAKLFTNGPAFADAPSSKIDIESPDCGPSKSSMRVEHTPFGEDRFPELKWAAPNVDFVEYVLVVEDPDAPLPFPPTHGLYLSIPKGTTRITATDMQLVDPAAKEKTLNGGFKLGQTTTGTHYGGPRPILGHGPHRYFYELVALKEPLDESKLSLSPTKQQVAAAIEGKIAAWGQWIGIYERKWE